MNFWIGGKRADCSKLLKRVDMLLLNDEEARQLSGEANLPAAARAIRALGPRAVVIKRGDAGALLFHEGGVFAAPAFPIENVVDPTGAGDSFGGGFMGWIAREGDTSPATIRTAMIMGSVLASFSVEDFSLDRFRASTSGRSASASPPSPTWSTSRRSSSEPVRERCRTRLSSTRAPPPSCRRSASGWGARWPSATSWRSSARSAPARRRSCRAWRAGWASPPERHVASPTFALVNEHPGRVAAGPRRSLPHQRPARARRAGPGRRLRSRRGGDRMARSLPRRRAR